MSLEKSLKGQQGWRAERVGGLFVAAAAPPVGHAAGGEGLRLREGEHERRCVGSAGRGAGHHGRAQGLEVTVGAVGGGVEGLPVLAGVDGAGQVHFGHRPRRLHLRLGQQVQGLLQDGGVQVAHLDGGSAGDDGGGDGGEDGGGAGEDGVGGRGEGDGGGGGLGGRHGRGVAGDRGGDGGHQEVRLQLGGDFADGLVGRQDELEPFLLLHQIGDVILQARLLILKHISFLRNKRGSDI